MANPSRVWALNISITLALRCLLTAAPSPPYTLSSHISVATFSVEGIGLLELLDARVKHLLSQGLSTTRALMLSYQLAEELGKAFTERIVLESILRAEQQGTSGSIKRVLGLLRTLFVLSQVDEEPVFLRHGFRQQSRRK